MNDLAAFWMLIRKVGKRWYVLLSGTVLSLIPLVVQLLPSPSTVNIPYWVNITIFALSLLFAVVWAYIDLAKEWEEMQQTERQLRRQRLIDRRGPHLSTVPSILQSMRKRLDELASESIQHPPLQGSDLSSALERVGDYLVTTGYPQLYPLYIRTEFDKKRWDAVVFTSTMDAENIGISRLATIDTEWRRLIEALESQQPYFGECAELADDIRQYLLIIEDNTNGQLFNAFMSATRKDTLADRQGSVLTIKAKDIVADRAFGKVTKRIIQLCDGDDAK